jgi:hypothetical protein
VWLRCQLVPSLGMSALGGLFGIAIVGRGQHPVPGEPSLELLDLAIGRPAVELQQQHLIAEVGTLKAENFKRLFHRSRYPFLGILPCAAQHMRLSVPALRALPNRNERVAARCGETRTLNRRSAARSEVGQQRS